MNNKPLVSTVIIFSNSEKFLAEAIESVIAQTYDNWELLLVDDGSVDNSSAIALNYAENYPEKIRYLEHKNHQNRGKNASRNLGIKNARGKYIALLDGDDVWLPHKLEQQVPILEQYPQADMVYGKYYLWYSWTGKAEDKHRDKPPIFPLGVEPNTLVQPPQLLIPMLEGTTQAPSTCTPLLRREVFKQVGLFDENFRDIFEDQAFFAKVLHTVPVFVSNKFWAKYRQYPDSSMGIYYSAYQKDERVRYRKRLSFFKSVKDYLSQQEFESPEVLNFLNKRISRLEKKLWLVNTIPLISHIDTWWLQLLNMVMSIGRSILPFALRDWLWKKVGDRLYQ